MGKLTFKPAVYFEMSQSLTKSNLLTVKRVLSAINSLYQHTCKHKHKDNIKTLHYHSPVLTSVASIDIRYQTILFFSSLCFSGVTLVRMYLYTMLTLAFMDVVVREEKIVVHITIQGKRSPPRSFKA